MTNASVTVSTSVSPSSPKGFQAAFERSAAARAAIPGADLAAINLDIPVAIVNVLGALPRAKTLRDAIVSILPTFDLTHIDAIETYADALSYAHTAYLVASEPSPDLPALLERATELREQLVSDATALARRGLLDSKRVGEVKGGNGYLAVAYDLGALVHMLRERWTEISSKSAIQSSELDEAEKLFEQVSRAFAERSRQSNAVAQAADDRARAFTLLVNAYDQLRRAAIFVRWDENDADKFVPSLWAGRGGRGNAEKKSTPAPGENIAPTQPVATSPVESNPVTSGMPGASPFANG